MADVEEFVTITEAAKALGVSERQARRLAATLTATDKRQDSQRTHRGVPVAVVRYSAVEALHKDDAPREKSAGRTSGTVAASPLETNGVSSVMSADVAARIATAEQRAAVAEARAELLERERNDWKEQAHQALQVARAAQDQERAGRLLGSGRSMQAIEAHSLAGADSSESSAQGGVRVPPDDVEMPQKGIRAWLRRMW